MSVDQSSWEAAVLHLYDDAYAFIASGPRRHEDWVLDVFALTARSVADPRGWTGLDPADRDPRHGGTGDTYPFAVHPSEYVAERLWKIDRESAENLLLALTDDGATLANLARFTESEKELRAMVLTILARYGDEASYHTNVKKPGYLHGKLDFTTSDWSYNPLTIYTEDTGLVVVTDTEVGMFWNFADW